MGAKANLDDYVMVHERIQAFYDKFNEGSIQTEIVYIAEDNSEIVVKASVYRTPEDPRPCTGHAHELISDGYINKTSMWENAETSAVGRALAFLGFEVKRGIASREEVEGAQMREAIIDRKGNAESSKKHDERAAKREAEVAVFKEIRDAHEKLGVADDDAAKRELLAKSGIAKSFRNLDSDKLNQYLAFLKGELAKSEASVEDGE